MALVYRREAAVAFFAAGRARRLDALVIDVAYTHPQPNARSDRSAPPIRRHQLRRFPASAVAKGVFTGPRRDALKALPATAGGVQDSGRRAVRAQRGRPGDRSSPAIPELKPLYDDYVASAGAGERSAALLASFQPELSRRRKRQQALQRLSAAVGVELDVRARRCSSRSRRHCRCTPPGNPDRPALVTTSSRWRRRASPRSSSSATRRPAPSTSRKRRPRNLDYAPGPDGNPLPRTPVPARDLRHLERSLEAPESGFYNIVDRDGRRRRTPTLSSKARPSADAERQDLAQHRSAGAHGGELDEIVLTVEKVQDVVAVRWETPKRPREVIPARYPLSAERAGALLGRVYPLPEGGVARGRARADGEGARLSSRRMPTTRSAATAGSTRWRSSGAPIDATAAGAAQAARGAARLRPHQGGAVAGRRAAAGRAAGPRGGDRRRRRACSSR